MPWGDVTTQGNKLNLVVFDWPETGRLMLPGLESDIESARIVGVGKSIPVSWKQRGTWTELQVPCAQPDHPAGVIEVQLRDVPSVDQTLGVDPDTTSVFLAEFADVAGAEKKEIKWMEKFGEWKHMTQVGNWEKNGKAIWTVDVAEPGDYEIELTYKGDGRTVWRIESDEGAFLQNQQASASVYHTYPFGRMFFNKPGKHTLAVSLIDGDREKASLSAMRISPME